MTNLDCSVRECTNHKSGHCCLNSVQVQGPSAACSDETCCQSFTHQRGGYNFLHDPKSALEIYCKAENCLYNSGESCLADHVSISGPGSGGEASTKCATFKQR